MINDDCDEILVHPRDIAEVREYERAPTGLEDEPPNEEVLSMFVSAELQAGDEAGPLPHSLAPVSPIVPTLRSTPPYVPGAHRAAQRIVRMTLSYARSYLSRQPDKIENLLAMPTAGECEDKAARVIGEEALEAQVAEDARRRKERGAA